MGASREGVGETQPTGLIANMHGVAFNAYLYIGNTHKTDGVFYGLLPATATPAQTPDNAYIANVYRAVNAALTHRRQADPHHHQQLGQRAAHGELQHLRPAARLAAQASASTRRGATCPRPTGTPTGTARPSTGCTARSRSRAGAPSSRSPAATPATEPDSARRGALFMPDSGALVHHLGNQPRRRPHARIRTARRSFGASRVSANCCGLAKWSCVTAPPKDVTNSTTVVKVNVDGVPQPRYGSASGTSMAGPHSAAALALIMKRFPYMTNTQALYTMFTTGRQNNTISDAAGAAIPNPSAARSSRCRIRATAGTP